MIEENQLESELIEPPAAAPVLVVEEKKEEEPEVVVEEKEAQPIYGVRYLKTQASLEKEDQLLKRKEKAEEIQTQKEENGEEVPFMPIIMPFQKNMKQKNKMKPVASPALLQDSE